MAIRARWASCRAFAKTPWILALGGGAGTRMLAQSIMATEATLSQDIRLYLAVRLQRRRVNREDVIHICAGPTLSRPSDYHPTTTSSRGFPSSRNSDLVDKHDSLGGLLVLELLVSLSEAVRSEMLALLCVFFGFLVVSQALRTEANVYSLSSRSDRFRESSARPAVRFSRDLRGQ